MDPISSVMYGILINILTKSVNNLWEFRKKLILRESLSSKSKGKKGLILLVSNTESAMFAIENQLHLIEPEGLPERILERIWLIHSNDKQQEYFGPGTVILVRKIIERCMELVQKKQVLSLEITLNGEVWSGAKDNEESFQNGLNQKSKDLSLSLSLESSERPSLEDNSVVKIKISNKTSDAKLSLKPLKIKVENAVSPGDAQDTYRLVNDIFRKSDYLPSDIIADFTGGNKPMSFGMIMACLSEERELQYVSFNPETKKMNGPFVLESYQYSLFDLKEE